MVVVVDFNSRKMLQGTDQRCLRDSSAPLAHPSTVPLPPGLGEWEEASEAPWAVPALPEPELKPNPKPKLAAASPPALAQRNPQLSRSRAGTRETLPAQAVAGMPRLQQQQKKPS